MGFQSIENIVPPTTDYQATNKKYADDQIVASMTLNSTFLAELSSEVEVTSSAASTLVAPWGVVRTEGDSVQVMTTSLTSDSLSLSGPSTVTINVTYRLPSVAFANKMNCIFSFSRQSDGASVSETSLSDITAGTYSFTMSFNKESDGVETFHLQVIGSNRRFFVETGTQIEVFGSGGSFVKTEDFNLSSYPLESGSLPIGNGGSVVLQDSNEGKNKVIVTLVDSTTEEIIILWSCA